MKLQEWMHANDITIQEFSNRLGVHKNTVMRWVSGETKPFGRNLYKIKIATQDKVTAEDF